MPRVKFLRTIGRKDTLPKTSDNPASPELPFKDDGKGNVTMYQEGEVADLSDDDAEKVIRASLGEYTDAPVGPAPPPAPAFAQQPVPVVVVERDEASRPHRAAPAGPKTDSRGGATGGPPSSGDAPKGGK